MEGSAEEAKVLSGGGANSLIKDSELMYILIKDNELIHIFN